MDRAACPQVFKRHTHKSRCAKFIRAARLCAAPAVQAQYKRLRAIELARRSHRQQQKNSSQFTCSATKKDKTLLKFASRSPESIATFAENRFKIPSCIDYLPKTVTFTMFFNALRHVLPNSLKLSRSSPQLLTMLVRFLRFFPANVLPV